jgi:hypothetical protein
VPPPAAVVVVVLVTVVVERVGITLETSFLQPKVSVIIKDAMITEVIRILFFMT